MYYRSLPAQIIDGKRIAGDVLKEIRVETDEWIAQGNRAPQLTVVLVGEDPASSVYVKNKAKAASKAGTYHSSFHFVISVFTLKI